MDVLDDNPSFGRGTIFEFENKCFTIKKKRLFYNSVTIRIPYCDIAFMEYHGKTWKNNFMILLFGFLTSIFLEGIFILNTKSNLEIKYKVGEDEAHGAYTSRLRQEDVDEMMRLFEIEKEKCIES